MTPPSGSNAAPEIPMPTAAEIKKALKDAGLEVYRTRETMVCLAERVRENLLMDAQVSIRVGEPIRVSFVVRAQRTDFPSDSEEHLFERARALGATAIGQGYHEVSAEVRKVLDPGDGQRTIDTWCEVSFEKEAGDLATAIAEARFALTIEKSAAPERAPD